MTAHRSVKLYDITRGEKIKYGYYAALETVFRQYIDELESYFYDEYKLTFDFNYKIKTGLKFKEYLNSVVYPSPLFVFSLSPLIRDCLLKTDNRIINLILSREDLFKNGRAAIYNGFQIDSHNCHHVKNTVDSLLNLFQKSWAGIYSVETRLKKLISNRIKAKIMDTTESCVVVTLTMRQKKFKSVWEFCLSNYQLDRIIDKHGSRGLLASKDSILKTSKIKEHFTNVLLENSKYEIRGIIGHLDISHKELLKSYQNKKILPIRNELDNNVIVHMNGHPILSGDAGETNGRLSMQINGKYTSMKSDIRQSKKSFSKLHFTKK